MMSTARSVSGSIFLDWWYNSLSGILLISNVQRVPTPLGEVDFEDFLLVGRAANRNERASTVRLARRAMRPLPSVARRDRRLVRPETRSVILPARHHLLDLLQQLLI